MSIAHVSCSIREASGRPGVTSQAVILEVPCFDRMMKVSEFLGLLEECIISQLSGTYTRAYVASLKWQGASCSPDADVDYFVGLDQPLPFTASVVLLREGENATTCNLKIQGVSKELSLTLPSQYQLIGELKELVASKCQGESGGKTITLQRGTMNKNAFRISDSNVYFGGKGHSSSLWMHSC